MKALTLSLLFWVTSVTARGISIHIGTSALDVGIQILIQVQGTDHFQGWDAPGQLKASMAFQILWSLGGILELSLLVNYLRFIPVLQARAPYIMVLEMRACLLHVLTVSIAHDPDGHILHSLPSHGSGYANLLGRRL
jgi:hypothetical protein